MKTKILSVLIFGIILLSVRCTKYEEVILPYYDTIRVVVYDTSTTRQFDTIVNVVNDTNYVIITYYDTISTVTIGDQVWLTVDLQTLYYNDGTPISIVEDNALWGLGQPSACYIDNNTNSYLLYNWYAVNTSKLCPLGFRVASNDDWEKLSLYLGFITLKESTDLNGWFANAKRYRWGNGQFSVINAFNEPGIIWWTTSVDESANLPIYRAMADSNCGIIKYRHSANNGYSVRCIKNNLK
jgi:uncharacterized protein (TIGR02145 family)